MLPPSLRWLLVGSALSLLAGCSTLESTSAPAPSEPPPAVKQEVTSVEVVRLTPTPRVVVYRIDPVASLLEIRVYRAGKLGRRIGHNHIVSSRHLSGSVSVPGSLEQASFDLELPVDKLVVDDPVLREAAGKDFKQMPSQLDIAGTRATMLGEAGLDAGRYPRIKVFGRVVGGKPPNLHLDTSLQVHGSTQQVKVPVTVTRAEGMLTADGEFKVLQSRFGITPVSLVGGALRVQDEMTIRFRFVARRD